MKNFASALNQLQAGIAGRIATQALLEKIEEEIREANKQIEENARKIEEWDATEELRDNIREVARERREKWDLN